MTETLNPAQRAAVEHAQGPLVVLAGAGSGKTRVITHRIARLIERGTRPEAILAVTFTNKASLEMRRRLAEKLGSSSAQRVWLSTFHSFGLRFLREVPPFDGARGRFAVFDQSDTLGLIRDLLKRVDSGARRFDASAVQTRISLWKNAFISPEDAPDNDDDYDEIARNLYPKYRQALKTMRAVDFDDLVVVPAAMLRADEGLRRSWQARFRHILIDEFQDTNHAQLELTRLLVNDLGNICVVGDDDQAIYGWRGADVENIRQFDRYFRNTRVIMLEENYRSRRAVLEVANAVIATSPGRRHAKVLRPTRRGGEAVRLCAAEDPLHEARIVANEIGALVADRVPYKEIAVLYRSNLQARVIEDELRARQIPYQLFGGTQFFDRKEIKDALAYLRLLFNPYDEIALRRALQNPPRGIGSSTIEKATQHALARDMAFNDALWEVSERPESPAAARRGARALRAALEGARSEIRRNAPIRSAVRRLLEEAGFIDGLASEVRRIENVDFFLGSLERHAQRSENSEKAVEEFVQRFSLRFESGEDRDEGNRVTLATLHAVKGLEFDAVFLIGCVEGQLPHHRTTDPKVTEAIPGDVEEERRLFYVGVTRARDRLYLSYSKRRTLRGKPVRLTRSRFLEGLPESAAKVYEPTVPASMDHDELANAAAALLNRLQG